MLKKRLIPTLLFNNNNLVKDKNFKSERGVGTPLPAVKIYNLREVDELIFLDVSATNNKKDPNYELISEISKHCFVPLTVGGGIYCLDQIEKLLSCGADKVSINTKAINDMFFLKEACNIFGKQCITISIDYKYNSKNEPIVWTNSGFVNTSKNLIDVLQDLNFFKVGEILLTNIELDGTFLGFDIDLYKRVVSLVDFPVIASGGAGELSDFVKLVKETDVSAMAAASIFHFTEITPLDVKKELIKNNIKMRV